MVQNLESPGLSGRVDSPVVHLRSHINHSTKREGKTRRELGLNCVLHLILGLLLEMRQSPIGQFSPCH